MQQLTQLVQKYKDQSATEAELHELLLWLDKAEEELLFEWMESNDQPSGSEDTTFGKQRIRSVIMQKISASAVPELKNTPPKRTANRAYTIWATLAAACICILIIVGVIHQAENSTKKDTVAESIPGQPETHAFYAQDKSQHIILEDSSSVLLYPGSSLEYSSSYNTTDRQLLLKGNALFKVKKDPERPFIVTTRHSSTTALGTIFEVNEWKDSTTVFLSEGRVKVHAADNQNEVLFLAPGDRAIT
ncbi:MAG TPA: FecR family protein, partial [Niabella sp.]|nr:FecR family protein [Niabella sp.]